jgi:RNA polymerase sigma-70 factor (ECF subfamily)
MRLRVLPGGEGTGSTEMEKTDEELLKELAAGREASIGALYSRYAPIVFGMARQAVDRGTAEEIVQDVFLAVWRGASSFDPAKGSARSWLLQIAHYRIANALRSRSRRPRTASESEAESLADATDPSPDPGEEAWANHRRAILRSALDALPPPQRQALGLAYFEELSHGEVAEVLRLPLGTAKSRIRAGLAGLRRRLAPISAVLAIALAVGVAVRLAAKREDLARDERALTMLTSSDLVSLRLSAAEGIAPETHATYRFRPSGTMAVLTVSNFEAAPPGEIYRAWILEPSGWSLLGQLRPGTDGKARLIVEGRFAARPQALEITRESAPGPQPAGRVVVRWSAAPP